MSNHFKWSNPLNWYKNNRYKRLQGSLLSYKNEVERRKADAQSSTDNKGWIVSIGNLLDETEYQLRKKNIDEAWKCFLAAQRMEIYAFTGEEIISKAITIRREAEKMNEWRKNSIYDLLGKPDSAIINLTHEQVYQAALIRDEYSNNQAYKDLLIRTYYGLLALMLTALGIIFIVLFYFDLVLLGCIQEEVVCSNKMFPGIIILGLLGSIFSVATKSPVALNNTRIPELIHGNRLTFLRILIGGVSAFVIFIFIKSDFTGNLFTFKDSHIEFYTYYVIAFASGISERIVLKAMEVIIKEKNNPG
jgi:hypothetical protein